MKKMMVSTVVALAAVVALMGVVLAGVPEDKASITVDLLAGKKGAVTFAHAKHATGYKKADGSAIACKDCHHTMKAETDKVQACAACHVAEGEAKEVEGKKAPALGTAKAPGEIELKSILMHKTCVDCHKAVSEKAEKKIGGCTTCHPAKK